jgi:hypothetical protein
MIRVPHAPEIRTREMRIARGQSRHHRMHTSQDDRRQRKSREMETHTDQQRNDERRFENGHGILNTGEEYGLDERPMNAMAGRCAWASIVRAHMS